MSRVKISLSLPKIIMPSFGVPERLEVLLTLDVDLNEDVGLGFVPTIDVFEL